MITQMPSWSSLTPGLPQYRLVNDVITTHLAKVIKHKGKIYRAFFDNPNQFAYKFVSDNGSEQYFIKIYHRDIVEKYKTIQSIIGDFHSKCAYLSHPVIYGQIDGLYYAIFPLLNGVRCKPCASDLKLLGNALAQFHRHLKNIGDQALVIQKSDNRVRHLSKFIETILKFPNDILVKKPRVASFISKYSFDMIDHRDSQIIHGDLNPGNILINKGSKLIHFLDFEDMLHSYLPVLYDLAFIIERNILLPLNDAQKAFALSKVFLKAYFESGGNYKYHTSDEYILCILSLRAFLLLIQNAINGHSEDRIEWDKFYYLSQHAEKNLKLMKAILKESH